MHLEAVFQIYAMLVFFPFCLSSLYFNLFKCIMTWSMHCFFMFLISLIVFFQLIATIASCSNGAELEQWPELLPHLVLLLDAAAEPNRIHGAFSALSKYIRIF